MLNAAEPSTKEIIITNSVFSNVPEAQLKLSLQNVYEKGGEISWQTKVGKLWSTFFGLSGTSFVTLLTAMFNDISLGSVSIKGGSIRLLFIILFFAGLILGVIALFLLNAGSKKDFKKRDRVVKEEMEKIKSLRKY